MTVAYTITRAALKAGDHKAAVRTKNGTKPDRRDIAALARVLKRTRPQKHLPGRSAWGVPANKEDNKMDSYTTIIERRHVPTINTPKPVVLYLRGNSRAMYKNSIETQRSALHSYCATNGLTIAAEYVDEGASGNSPLREGFQSMLADATSNPEWDTILVQSHSRFFRNAHAAHEYTTHLGNLGIQILSITQPAVGADAQQLMQDIVCTFAEYKRADSSK